jgi:type IV pilus assembly protein PilB
MIMSDALRTLIMKQVSTTAIREAAIAEGMKPLRTSGMVAIYNGVTTIEEVVRETLVEQD